MGFIKKNKVFVFLCSFIIVCIGILSVALVRENLAPPTTNTGSGSQANHTQIDRFKVDLNNQMQLTFNWDIRLGKESIEKMEIYHDNVLLEDVSEAAHLSLSFLKGTIPTGNEEFEFVVTLGNKQQIRKTAFLYLNEAFDFKVQENRTANKVEYIVSYYYEKTHSVGVPKVAMRLNQNISLPLKFIKSEKEDVSEHFVRVNCVYELDLTGAREGNYTVDYTWTFNEYNLDYQTTSRFDI